MRLIWSFAAEPRSVAAARRDVAEALADLPPDVLDRLLLMLSELVTNAVRHAGTPCTVVVERNADDVRVEVHDDGPGEALLRIAEPTEPSGRGLRIVDTLADQWAVVREPGRDGKTVRFGVSLRAAPAVQDLPRITTSAEDPSMLTAAQQPAPVAVDPVTDRATPAAPAEA